MAGEAWPRELKAAGHFVSTVRNNEISVGRQGRQWEVKTAGHFASIVRKGGDKHRETEKERYQCWTRMVGEMWGSYVSLICT